MKFMFMHRTNARLSFVNGKCTVTKGPLVGNNELIAGFAVMKLGSLDEAIEWSTKFAREGELDILQVQG